VAYEDAELGMESARRAGMTVVDVRDIPGVPDPRKDART
jgi:beta-phosphoglucomutase-like phosphatase (HAD superfamily)